MQGMMRDKCANFTTDPVDPLMNLEHLYLDLGAPVFAKPLLDIFEDFLDRDDIGKMSRVAKVATAGNNHPNSCATPVYNQRS